ncbi:uncharacterized protein N7473_003629 [Penicillium subrubescens]|uniref:Uncharacterized protein n=1 Tax=Penicillium subrubescens TaxID=1316194 RepID=A0A1Q5TL75_9EURO|nr:uncharacterized protein N7473_003629 [Penicillium subrubescens]KAJ5906713.1 hypothetical protein N7473_003629 [Penicillium subrubescens]OKP00976.1 hypothetical protein PENSUB_7557 [Penicillium subrubescens]
MDRLQLRDYTVAWICALSTELSAARAMLDEEHAGTSIPAQDDNAYIYGRVGSHNVVLACLPKGVPGTTSAANVAKDIARTFPSISLSFMIGIGGGVPDEQNDIHLGDVVVSVPSDGYGGVVQYDFGKTIKEGKFCTTGTVNKPAPKLLGAVQRLQSTHDLQGNKISHYINEAARKYPHKIPDFSPPGAEFDRLFESEYEHVTLGQTCSECGCDLSKVKRRPARFHRQPKVFYGNIASGNQVIKHGRTRDRLAHEHSIICFEMEAAGLMNTFACLVIRGISDYADSHKNDGWHGYAAVAAAAYAKELLLTIPAQRIEKQALNKIRQPPSVRGDATMSLLIETCLLETLRFELMDERYSRISKAHQSLIDAHKSTFDWIFTKPGPGFVDWMSTYGGIYWINGKAGSGKSTLMKYILESRVLRRTLSASDSSCQWAIAGFFFWSGGSQNQRSQAGLLRTILYQLLKECKDLVNLVFVEERELIRSTLNEVIMQDAIERERSPEKSRSPPTPTRKFIADTLRRVTLDWDVSRLLRALGTVLSQKELPVKFFLMIDGLDEYEATEDELEQLIEVLKSSTNPKVKICVSSRPWTIFERHFGNSRYPTLLLQNLTYSDIQLFVFDSFNRSDIFQSFLQAHPTRMHDFGLGIVRKSDGVFLWVRLVVKAIIRGTQNGDQLSDLQAHLDELPADLERLYRHMLLRVPQRYRIRSARIFAIVHASTEPPLALTLWHSGEVVTNPMEKLTDNIKLARCYQVHLRLMSQCAGLLEIRIAGIDQAQHEQDDPDLMRPEGSWSFSNKQIYSLHSRVHYMHRTTRDFLQTSEIKSLFQEWLGEGNGFDAHQWLAARTLVDLLRVQIRIRGSGTEDADDIYEFYGFELDSVNRQLVYHAEKVANRNVRNRISKLRSSISDSPKRGSVDLKHVATDLQLLLENSETGSMSSNCLVM